MNTRSYAFTTLKLGILNDELDIIEKTQVYPSNINKPMRLITENYQDIENLTNNKTQMIFNNDSCTIFLPIKYNIFNFNSMIFLTCNSITFFKEGYFQYNINENNNLVPIIYFLGCDLTLLSVYYQYSYNNDFLMVEYNGFIDNVENIVQVILKINDNGFLTCYYKQLPHIEVPLKISYHSNSIYNYNDIYYSINNISYNGLNLINLMFIHNLSLNFNFTNIMLLTYYYGLKIYGQIELQGTINNINIQSDIENNNIVYGTKSAHSLLLNASNNAAFGNYSLQNNTIGNNNISFGIYSLQKNISGNDNCSIGFNSLKNNNTGNSNIAIGSNSLLENISGFDNIAIGLNSLSSSINSSSNIAIGNYSLNTNTGNNNIAIGNNSLINNATGNFNIAIGNNSLVNSSNQFNISIGYNSLNVSNVDSNIAIGYRCLENNTSGLNIGIGSLCLSVAENQIGMP